MATLYWRGTSGTLAQVATAAITGYDAGTTYKITIGDLVASQVGTGGTAITTATAFVAVLNAITAYPQFTAITWSNVGGTSATITATADTAGMPFVFSTSVTGGAGTFGAYTVSTASAGPNDWSTAYNWSTSTVPVNGDDVIIEDNSVPILWGLDQSAVTLTSLRIKKTYTGKIGLNRLVFATNAAGTTTDTAWTEYRSIYLSISATTINIGENFGPSSPAGSGRIMLNTGTTAATIIIHSTAQTPSETGKQAVRLKANVNTTDIFVRSAPGGVGIATDAPGETSTVRKISVDDLTTTSRVTTGPGVTHTTWYQDGGQNVQQAAATVTTSTVNGGTLQTEGAFTTTTLNQTGGTVTQNATGTAITAANIYGGTLDFTGSNQARTVTTLTVYRGATVRGLNSSIITLTNDLVATQGCTITA